MSSADPSALVEEEFDLVVLSVGMEISESVRRLGRKLGVELDDYGFCHTARFDPLQTSRPGIYAVGPFRSPKDIPETVIDASGAAAQAGALLAPSRGTLVRQRPSLPERDVSGQEPRIGVFVCHCGSNIAGFLDVPAVTEYARRLPGVVHAEDLLYACSQDSIAAITERVRELGLNRAVVASCTPLTHGPLFQDSIRQAGLNEYLLEMANIRNQCSWVHSDQWDVATEKAKDLVRMAVARVTTLEPLHKSRVPVERVGLVIGGGVAGMNAALALAEQGIRVHLVEREAELGGNLRHVHYLTTDDRRQTEERNSQFAIRNSHLDSPQVYLRELIESVTSHSLIHVHLATELEKTTGFVGNFTSTLRNGKSRLEVRHGATIVATGAREYRGPDYGYGTDPRLLTQQELESLLAGERGSGGAGERGSRGAEERSVVGGRRSALPNSVVMIQCVGPAEKYCGRICCNVALKNALKLKELNPRARVTVLYRDIRTYGFHERLYTEARRQGVLFVRYDDEYRPEVRAGDSDRLVVKAWDSILGQEIRLTADVVVLSMPMVPSEGAKELGTKLKVGMDLDGWFQEAHVKLRPVDFASDGVFMAGAAHYPKLLDETIVQARAAAARAATILTKEALSAGGIVAQVNRALCVGCLTCVRVCPYGVPRIAADFTGVGGILGAAYIDTAVCQGCGICVAECPARAIQLAHYRDEQMEVRVNVLMRPEMLVVGV